jgi:hypothetical protein
MKRSPRGEIARPAAASGVKAGEVGEFIVRLPAEDTSKGFQGYFGDAAATNSKILRDVFKKGDAWSAAPLCPFLSGEGDD